jgi:FKBP12-rapamycin complex-associated protein
MLAQSVGQALTKHMHELLDLMFAFGLSRGLFNATVQLGKDIPPLLPEIQGPHLLLPFLKPKGH